MANNSTSPEEYDWEKHITEANDLTIRLIGFVNRALKRAESAYDFNQAEEFASKIASLREIKSMLESLGGVRVLSLFPLEVLHNMLDLLSEDDFDKGVLQVIESIDEIYSLIKQGIDNVPEVPFGDDDDATIEAYKVMEDISDRIELRNVFQRAEMAVQAAEKGARHVQEVAGETGSLGLAHNYSQYAKREQRQANFLRYTVTFLSIGVTVLASRSLSSVSDKLTWVELARHLALAAPGVALAAYFARESKDHRDRANWAEAIAVQLRTIFAYTDSLEKELRDEIRGEFGKCIFYGSASFHNRSVPPVGDPLEESNNKQTSSGGQVEILRLLLDTVRGNPK
ncbi:hypothetical protein [Actinomadura sp. NPDC048394]|uniref:hypothetical protein n=1 Tax=Actinomadura sp. NPDC048394 TaxID=3158223 RepID=UPI0033DDB079